MMKIQGINTNQSMAAMQRVQKPQQEDVKAQSNNATVSAAKNAEKVAAKSDSGKVSAKVQVAKDTAKAGQVAAQNKPNHTQMVKASSENAQKVQNSDPKEVARKMQTYNAGGNVQMMQAASEMLKGQKVDFTA